MFEINERVMVHDGVYSEGYNLSGYIGIVRSTDSYIRVYFPEIEKTLKMLSYEIETSNRLTIDDIEELFSEQ